MKKNFALTLIIFVLLFGCSWRSQEGENMSISHGKMNMKKLLFLIVAFMEMILVASCSVTQHEIVFDELSQAIAYDEWDVVQDLIQRGETVNTVQGFAHCKVAMEAHGPEYLSKLLSFALNLDINEQDADGMTLLMYASGSDYAHAISYDGYVSVDKCKVILDAGADISLQSKKGLTALDYALFYAEDDSVVDFLLKNDAPVSSKTVELGVSALRENGTGYWNLKKLVEQSGILPKNKWLSKLLSASEKELLAALDGRSPDFQALLDIAAFGSLPLLQNVLEKQPEVVQKIKEDNQTLLYAAADAGNLENVQYLIEMGSPILYYPEGFPIAVVSAVMHNDVPLFQYLCNAIEKEGYSVQQLGFELVGYINQLTDPEIVKVIESWSESF